MKSTDQLEEEERQRLEQVREEKRRDLVKKLNPGSRVRIIERSMPGPSGKSYRLTRLSTWKLPNAEGIKLARAWSKRQHDQKFRDEFDNVKGPTILLGETAMVLAVLPDLPDELSPSRPWVLLMTVNGRIGWCYAIDGLELVPMMKSKA